MRRTAPTTTFGNDTVSRYDLLLAALPIPLLLGIGSGVATDMPVALGVSVGGIPSALLLGYGLFVDAPTAERGLAKRRGSA
ncbi:hypothetical protein [Halobellus captivus]|uniref:hypothetical protein n=1 Tax=Halobellus captivus TaxID=2592614 RepID=UPI0011A7078F|nr:hypothetical protein [Halobellus captivus]